MATLAELQTMKSALETARFSGQRRVRIGQSEVEYKSDTEMKAALADIDRQIGAASATPITVVKINASKGF